jgi:hypothetical protein
MITNRFDHDPAPELTAVRDMHSMDPTVLETDEFALQGDARR